MAALLPFRDINVHASTSQYAFTSPSSPNSPTLVIDRPSGDIRLQDGSPLGAKRVSSIAGILGIIKSKLGRQTKSSSCEQRANWSLDRYVIVITKAQPMGRLKGHMIYRVVATEFLPLREGPLRDPEEDTYMSLLKRLLITGPMYFSYSFDLTNSFQRQARSDPNLPLWRRADDRFFWNRFIQTDLIDFRTGGGSGGVAAHLPDRQQAGADPFILPVMFGMLRITTTAVKATPFTFVLITRRSRHRAGTRYFSRGIDDQGHVSNFNETEQIVILNDSTSGLGGFAGGGGMQKQRAGQEGREVQVVSYVQTRGSVPVYWAEINNLHYTPKLQVRNAETALGAAKLHFDEQIRLYGDNYLVNLVNQKGREERVKAAYEQLVKSLVSTPSESTASNAITNEQFRLVEPQKAHQRFDRLHYIYFDFHNETKGLRWHRAQLLLDRMNEALSKQQYFRGIDMPADAAGRLEVRNQQTSVIRTNCMDCLDRTNLVQSMMARQQLNRAFADLGILQRGESAFDDRVFENLFRNVWADNADVVSKSYSGTGALKTDFTRTGERTRAGMLQDFSNSITRYFTNNFADGPRQDAFDLFLGSYLPSTSGSGASSRVFLDGRPILIQSVPYLLAASLFLIFIGTFSRRLPDAAILPIRVFVLVWFLVGLWCLRFIYTHGMLYVNWPKLNPLPWATEGYNENLTSARKDKLVGPLMGKRERAFSNARLGYLEEGKKRIE